MLKDLSLKEYSELLASDSPSPGGGSAIALFGANCAALAQMAANVTLKKLARKETVPDNSFVCMKLSLLCEKLETHRRNLLQLVDGDAQAFDKIIAAMRMPKDTEENAARRENALQDAYYGGAETGLLIAENIADVALLAANVEKLSNRFVASDATIATIVSHRITDMSFINVDDNASFLTDEEQRQHISDRKAAVLDKLAFLKQ